MIDFHEFCEVSFIFAIITNYTYHPSLKNMIYQKFNDII